MTKRFHRAYVRRLVIWSVLCLLLVTVLPFVNALALTEASSGLHALCLSLANENMVLIGCMFLVGYSVGRAYPIPPVRWPVRARRACSYVVVAVCVAISLGLAHGIREAAFAASSERAEPIIEALSRYHSTTGAYPETLSALVPEYLDVLPRPGLSVCEHFSYQRADQASPFKFYQLSIEVNDSLTDVTSVRRLVYWPENNYTAHFVLGEQEDRGDWLWLHH